MGTTEQLSAQDSQGNVNTDLAISGAQPELTMGEIERVMANMMSVLKDKNATADALHKRFSRRTDMPVDHCIPFSSDRKYSGVAFKTCLLYTSCLDLCINGILVADLVGGWKLFDEFKSHGIFSFYRQNLFSIQYYRL